MLDNLAMSLRPGETLQKFLKDQACAINGAFLQETPEFVNLGNIRRRIAPQGQ